MIPWLAGAAFAAIAPEAPAEAGAETVLAVTGERGEVRSGETVRVVHRPGLAGEREVAIGITDGRGRVRWTPEEGGLARLRAGDETQMIRIAPASFDPSVPLLLAALLGAGGASLWWAARAVRA